MVDLTGRTVVADPAVLQAWRTGPRWYHVVVAMIDSPEVEERRRTLCAALGDLVTPSAPGQAHVTIWAAGFEPPGALPSSGRIPLTIGGPDTFVSAAYLTVTGTGVDRVRSRMIADGFPEDRADPFIPHVTLGTYRREVPLTQVLDALHTLPEAVPLPVMGDIRHLVVDTRSEEGTLAPVPS